MNNNKKIEAIFGDWGTSSLRLWAVDPDYHTLSEYSSEQGASRLNKSQFEPILKSFLSDHDLESTQGKCSVVLCGMVGSKIGWKEVPYLDIAQPSNEPAISSDPTLANEMFNVWILGGLKQDKPAEVMRGEETQIQGFLTHYPTYTGILCLPGTHSKWVKIKAGEIQSFKTVMTGELYGLLKSHSTLSHIMQDNWVSDSFESAVRKGADCSADLVSLLFSVRAELLLQPTTISGSATVSGLLIGAELATNKCLIENNELHFVGEGALMELYAQAATVLGIECQQFSGSQAAFAGLLKNYKEIKANR